MVPTTQSEVYRWFLQCLEISNQRKAEHREGLYVYPFTTGLQLKNSTAQWKTNPTAQVHYPQKQETAKVRLSKDVSKSQDRRSNARAECGEIDCSSRLVGRK